MSQKKISIEYSEIQEQVFFNWPKGVKYKTWRKGRRAGATKGAANAFIELMVTSPVKLLWGDTIHSNINRYFDRYLEPVLKSNKISYHWSDRDKQLNIGDSISDFRSSDQPENWEGFGYNLIFLNEAGIILKNRDLYLKTVLPMLIDYPDSKLIAAGVPKGKRTKDGQEHIFYTLNKRAIEQPQLYMDCVSTAYDNPWIEEESVRQLEAEMFAVGGQNLVDQEIYGLFVDAAVNNTFIIHFDKQRHVAPISMNIDRQLILSIDFNLRPFCVIAAHVWFDSQGFHCHVVDEFKIEKGSIPLMVDTIKRRYNFWLDSLLITGDHMGVKGDISQRDNASYYDQIRDGLNLRRSQIKNFSNPTHSNSSADCNYAFYYHPDLKIKETLKDLIFDIENVQVNPDGTILKSNRDKASQQADFIDCLRYLINGFLKDWIKIHKSIKK